MYIDKIADARPDEGEERLDADLDLSGDVKTYSRVIKCLKSD